MRSAFKRLAAVATVFVALLVAGGVAAAPASADTCAVAAYAPTYSGGYVTASGSVSGCSSYHLLDIQVKLTRDGTQVNSSFDTCSSARSCSGSTSGANVSGNQSWCSVVAVWIDNTHYGPYTNCESQSWFA